MEQQHRTGAEIHAETKKQETSVKVALITQQARRWCIEQAVKIAVSAAPTVGRIMPPIYKIDQTIGSEKNPQIEILPDILTRITIDLTEFFYDFLARDAGKD